MTCDSSGSRPAPAARRVSRSRRSPTRRRGSARRGTTAGRRVHQRGAGTTRPRARCGARTASPAAARPAQGAGRRGRRAGSPSPGRSGARGRYRRRSGSRSRAAPRPGRRPSPPGSGRGAAVSPRRWPVPRSCRPRYPTAVARPAPTAGGARRATSRAGTVRTCGWAVRRGGVFCHRPAVPFRLRIRISGRGAAPGARPASSSSAESRISQRTRCVARPESSTRRTWSAASLSAPWRPTWFRIKAPPSTSES